MTILVGKNSFIARHVRAQLSDCVVIDHLEASQEINHLIHPVVVNFALDPRYMTEKYSSEIDFDRRLASALPASSHYIFLSSRKIYQASVFPVTEVSPLLPTERYGENKILTESCLLTRGRYTAFRASSVIGYDPGRRSFMGVALKNLATRGEIVLDSSPFLERDFIPVEDAAKAISRWIVKLNDSYSLRANTWTFNLGAGFSTPIGLLALWVIEGFGSGRLVIEGHSSTDTFKMDTSLLRDQIGDYMQKTDIRDYCVELGRRLKRDKETFTHGS